MDINNETNDIEAENATNEVGVGGSRELSNVRSSSEDNLICTSNELGRCQIFGYGIGHFYNDLCASMWFTYLLLFLKKVIDMNSSVAGLILLIGQVTDALSTALIGVLSDWTPAPFCLQRFGQRKSWHIAGTILVTCSFAFIYNKCFMCANSTTVWKLFAWYTPFVTVFQIGWAAVQVSHLALLPELTSSESRRTTMNSVRYGSTVVANLAVFLMLSLLLHFDDTGSAIGPGDLQHFSTAAFTVVGFGLFTQIIFYVLTKEPLRVSRTDNTEQQGILHSFKVPLLRWTCRFQFYQVGIFYMLCRLFINLSQVYFPFYITHIRNLSKKYVAVLPMVTYCASLLTSSLIGLPFFNRRLSLKVLALCGCLLGISNCSTMQFGHIFSVYVTAVLLGIAQAILLITSLSVVAQLISQETESSAFVYGIFSSLDKISNGLFLQAVELASPLSCRESSAECARFYLRIVVFLPGTCLVVAIFIICSLILRERYCLPPQQNTQTQIDNEGYG